MTNVVYILWFQPFAYCYSSSPLFEAHITHTTWWYNWLISCSCNWSMKDIQVLYPFVAICEHHSYTTAIPHCFLKHTIVAFLLRWSEIPFSLIPNLPLLQYSVFWMCLCFFCVWFDWHAQTLLYNEDVTDKRHKLGNYCMWVYD